MTPEHDVTETRGHALRIAAASLANAREFLDRLLELGRSKLRIRLAHEVFAPSSATRRFVLPAAMLRFARSTLDSGRALPTLLGHAHDQAAISRMA